MDTFLRAERAKLLLQDETLGEAISSLRQQHIDTFTGQAPAEQVMEARHAVWALDALKARLQSYIDDAVILKKRQNKAAPS